MFPTLVTVTIHIIDKLYSLNVYSVLARHQLQVYFIVILAFGMCLLYDHA